VARTDVLDLSRLVLSPGEARRLDLEVALDPVVFGGQSYDAARAPLPVTLDVARTASGWSLRLRFDAELVGPCTRCLEQATVAIVADAREVDQPGDEDLASPYLDGAELDLRAWARDALALELPALILCDEACRGLCPVCGENLNRLDGEHAHPREPDARWAKLSELRLD
jgi:uncharacterized protein